MEVERYDPYSNTWSPTCPAPKYVSNFTATACHGKLYVIGSCAVKYNALTMQCFSPVIGKTETSRLDGITFSQLVPTELCVVTVDDSVSGLGASTPVEAPFIQISLIRFGGHSRTTAQNPPSKNRLMKRRESRVVSSLNTRVSSRFGSSTSFHGSAEKPGLCAPHCLFVCSESWTGICSAFMPRYLSSPRSACMDGIIYLVADNTKKVFSYNPEDNIWQKVPLETADTRAKS